MIGRRTALAACTAILAACAAVPPESIKANVVMARSVERGTGARGVTDSFTFAGSIYVFAALTWNPDESGGTKSFEARWFNGENLVSTQRSPAVRLTPPPYFVYFYTSGLALGAGDCRVELYVDGVLVGARGFRVREV